MASPPEDDDTLSPVLADSETAKTCSAVGDCGCFILKPKIVLGSKQDEISISTSDLTLIIVGAVVAVIIVGAVMWRHAKRGQDSKERTVSAFQNPTYGTK